MTAQELQKLKKLWENECFSDKVCHRIDPSDQFHWLSLCVGWAVAKGISPEKAYEVALCLYEGMEIEIE